MFNVMKKRANGLREAKMAASHDQRRGAPDKAETGYQPLMHRVEERVDRFDTKKEPEVLGHYNHRIEEMPEPSAAFEAPTDPGVEDHNALADHHQKLADHFRAMSKTDAAGRPTKPAPAEGEDY